MLFFSYHYLFRYQANKKTIYFFSSTPAHLTSSRSSPPSFDSFLTHLPISIVPHSYFSPCSKFETLSSFSLKSFDKAWPKNELS